jgi:hypothetical protein
MYIKRNNETRSCNHFCSGKAINITFSKSAFVALGIQHPMRMRHIFMCCLPRSTIFFPRYLINGKIFGKKKSLNKKCVFWFSLQRLSETLLILRRKMREMSWKMYIGLLYSLPISKTLEFSRQIFEKSPKIKLHENPPSCPTRKENATLIFAFHNTAKSF